MKHEAKLRQLAAILVKNAPEDNRHYFLCQVYGAVGGRQFDNLFSVSSAKLVVQVRFVHGNEAKTFDIQIPAFDQTADIKSYVNRYFGKEVLTGEIVRHGEIVYKGKKPIAFVAYEKEVDEKVFDSLPNSDKFKFPTAPYEAELLLPENQQDDVTRKLTNAEISAAEKLDDVVGYFTNEIRSLDLGDEDLQRYFEGVVAKSLLGDLPHYSFRNRYNFAEKNEAVFGAYSVTHGPVKSSNLLFAQVRKLDGMLGHFGGFGRLDPSEKLKDGIVINKQPEQPETSASRESCEEIPKFGEILKSSKLNLLTASIMPRKNSAADIAFGFDRKVPEAVMAEVIRNIRESRLSEQRGEALAKDTDEEVASFLIIPISIALALRKHFRYPHEFNTLKAVGDKLGIKAVTIADCPKNAFAEILETDSELKNLYVIVERMAVEKAVDAVIAGSNKKDVEAEFNHALDKYARAALSLIKPNKYDINTNLTAIHEIEDYMAGSMPVELAKTLGMEKFKKKRCFGHIVIDYEYSDVVYARIPKDELFALNAKLKRAFNFNSHNYLTQETTKHERVLLHAALNIVAVNFGIDGVLERERGINFNAATMPPYQAYSQEYDALIKSGQKELQDQLKFFKDKLKNFDSWREEGLSFPYDEALKMYQLGKQRIADGLYLPERDDELEELVGTWMLLKLEHKVHLEKAHSLLQGKIPESERTLKYYSNEERQTWIVTGGIASGKTYLTKQMITELGISAKDVVINDPEASKRTLANGAVLDNIISKGLNDPNNNWGARVHWESSNVRYEETLLLAELARQGKCPNVMINMLSPNKFEVDMALVGGAKLHVEMISIGIDEALADMNRRALGDGLEGITNRLPPLADFRRSHKYANTGLLRLLEYKGKNITANLRERVGTDVNNIYASYDAQNNALIINDIHAFSRMAERAFQTGSAVNDLQTYFEKLVAADVKINFAESERGSANSKVAVYLKRRLEGNIDTQLRHS